MISFTDLGMLVRQEDDDLSSTEFEGISAFDQGISSLLYSPKPIRISLIEWLVILLNVA